MADTDTDDQQKRKAPPPMLFCPEWFVTNIYLSHICFVSILSGNILYPKEKIDADGQHLIYYCKFCPHTQPADKRDPCVYRHYMNGPVLTASHHLASLATDPTLPTAAAEECAKCHKKNVAYIQSSTGASDGGVRITYICRTKDCHNTWST